MKFWRQPSWFHRWIFDWWQLSSCHWWIVDYKLSSVSYKVFKVLARNPLLLGIPFDLGITRYDWLSLR